MRFHTIHRLLLTGVLAIATMPVSDAARADDILPWLKKTMDDPFASEEKAAKLVAPKLKPDTCKPADTKRKLSFNDVVIAVLCNNPDTKNAYTTLVIQAANYVTSYSEYLPNASASMSRTRSTSFTGTSKDTSIGSAYGLSLGMTLYDFGQREFRLENAERALIIAGHSYNQTIQGAIASALQSYYNLLNAQNNMRITKESENFARESYEASTLRYEIGQVPLADKLQARNAYSSAQLATEAATNSLALQQASIAQLMGLPPDTVVMVADLGDDVLARDPFGGDVRALMDRAKEKRRDLQATRESLKSAETSLKALKRSNLASISATTSMGISNDHVNLFNNNGSRTQAIGFSVSIPIFNGFRDTYSERNARLSLESQKQSLIQTERNVERDVWNSWHNYETAKASWQTSQDQIATATLLKDVALGRYKEGLGTILDVLNAQLQYRNALQSQLQNRYNLLTSRVDLVRAVGELNLETMQPETIIDKAPVIVDNSSIDKKATTQ